VEVIDINKDRTEDIWVLTGPDKSMDEHGTIWYTISIDGDVLPELISLGKDLHDAADTALSAYGMIIAEQMKNPSPDRRVLDDAEKKYREYTSSRSYQTLRLISYILTTLLLKYHDNSPDARELLAVVEKVKTASPTKYKKHLPDPTEKIAPLLRPLPIKKLKYYDVMLPNDVYQLLDPKETSLLSDKALKQLGRGQVRRMKITIAPPPEYSVRKKESVPDASRPPSEEKQDMLFDLRGYGWKVLRSMVPTDAPKKLDGSYVEAGQKFEHEEESPGLSAAFSLITTPVSSNQNVTVRETRYSKLTLEYWARRVEAERGATRMALTLYKILMYLTQFQRHYVRPISANEAIITVHDENTDWYDPEDNVKRLFPLSSSPIAVDRDNPPRWNLYACTIGTYLQWITGERRDEGPLRTHVPVFITKKSCSSYREVWARFMLACPFPFMEFSWEGHVHRLDPYANNVQIVHEQRKYQHMWQKISIDGKFCPNIVFIVADAVDDEDSAVHVDTNVTVGTIANAPGLTPPNPVVMPAPLDIFHMLLSKKANGWRTWSNLFLEYCNIADPRDIQLAVNAYKATSNVCLHVDNLYDVDLAVTAIASSAHFRYTQDINPGPFLAPPLYTTVSPEIILDHALLSTLPPGYGICSHTQLASSQRPVLELPESSDLKIAMRMVQMTGPTSKMSVGTAFLMKLLIPELTFHINAVLVTEFEKFVVANGVHMAEVSFSAFSHHQPKYVHYTGLESHILDRMQMLWECKFIPYAGKSAALEYKHRIPSSLIQSPGNRLVGLRRSHLPWFDRMDELSMVKQYVYSLNDVGRTVLVHNKTSAKLWSENEAFDTYIRRSVDPAMMQANYVRNVYISEPSGQRTIVYIPVVRKFVVLCELVQRSSFAKVHPYDTDRTRVVEAYWSDSLSDRYNPYLKSQTTYILLELRSTMGEWSNPVSPKAVMYKQTRNYGSDNTHELLGNGTDDQIQLLVY